MFVAEVSKALQTIHDVPPAFKEELEEPLAAVQTAMSVARLLLGIVPDKLGCVTMPGVALKGVTLLGAAFITYWLVVWVVPSVVIAVKLKVKLKSLGSCEK